MKNLYFDILSGASGDMILAALIDVGVPIDFLQKELSKLAIPGFSIRVEKQNRSGINCSHVLLSWDGHHEHVDTHENTISHHKHPHDNSHSYEHSHHDEHHHHAHEHPHHSKSVSEVLSLRNADDILAIIKKADYNPKVYDDCKRILDRISEAEATVHGVTVDKVHFHEIGAIDTIIDVAGISLCLEYLQVNQILFSSLIDGHGTVKTRHGLMPVPVPAVAKLCVGFKLKIINIESELLTPTGCGVLTALGTQTSSGISGKILNTGYGCGDKVFEKSPNALRVFLLETELTADFKTDVVCCLESDMDHISGEIMGDVSGRLFQAGALDVSWCPIYMKKSRPAYRLSVLCKPDKKQEFVDLIILHTRTLGVRMHAMERITTQRQFSEINFQDSKLTQKHCTYKNVSFTKPEYEGIAALATKTGRPVLELLEEYFRVPL